VLDDAPSLSAPELILSLLDAAPDATLTATRMVAAGDLLGIDPGALRVAAARLVKKGVLAQPARGVYRIGARGGHLQRAVLEWAQVESRLKPWKGDWIGVFTAHLKGTDRAVRRARARALRLRGFVETVPGLAVRPANLRLDPATLREELLGFGLDEAALVLEIGACEPPHVIDPGALWNREILERGYRANIDRLVASTARIADLDAFGAARETLLLGRKVMRDILLDPLLPDGLVDSRLRSAMIAAMKRYDALGKGCWRTFYRELG
jgi:phenylacetic acid degradation operon negative regulatory protein